eukprot:2864660-Amphidinium_carterae.1
MGQKEVRVAFFYPWGRGWAPRETRGHSLWRPWGWGVERDGELNLLLRWSEGSCPLFSRPSSLSLVHEWMSLWIGYGELQSLTHQPEDYM